jgi:hypothetical protein
VKESLQTKLKMIFLSNLIWFSDDNYDNDFLVISDEVWKAEFKGGLIHDTTPMNAVSTTNHPSKPNPSVKIVENLATKLGADNLQFQTARRLRSIYLSLWGASIHSMTSRVMAHDTIKTYVTKCPTYCVWFKRLIKGMYSRMGDDHQPDAAITVESMKALMNRININYIEASSNIDE